MRVVTVPCRTDNFTYLVGAAETTDVAVVDPCEPEPVLAAVRSAGLRVVAILNTHHHNDHIGGNRAVLNEFPGIPVYAHVSDRGRIPGQTHYLQDGDRLEAAGIRYSVLFIPGHTTGHIGYVTDGAVFVGDTLFGGGCGRLFEGTPEQMNVSLNEKLAKLPEETEVYFAHEYTATNLRFALTVDPDNPALARRIEAVKALRAAGRWTTPSTIGQEKATNPFLRVTYPALVQSARLPPSATPADVFGALRRARDRF